MMFGGVTDPSPASEAATTTARSTPHYAGPSSAPSMVGGPQEGSSSGGGGGGGGPSGAGGRDDAPDSSKKRKRQAKLEPGTDDSPGGIRSTQRAPLSCKECSRRKIRCDKLVPCRPCIERGEEAVCRRESVMVKGRVVLNDPVRDTSLTMERLAAENADIRRRLARLERAVPGVGHSAGGSAASVLALRSPSFDDHPVVPSEEATTEFKEDRLPGVMEEVAIGVGDTHRFKGLSLLTQPETPSLSKDAWYRSTPLEATLATIPTRPRCDALVRFYAEELHWHVMAIHMPTFMAQYDEFHAQFSAGQVKDDVWPALLFAVLSFAGYFMDEARAAALGFGADGELERLARTWFDCAMSILFRNNFLGQPNFTAMQTIQTLLYPFHLSGNGKIHPGMVFLSFWQARTINLHLLGSGGGGSPDERLAREMGRRVWWNMVHDDWSFIPYNMNCLIQMHSFTSAMPEMADDEDHSPSSIHPLTYRLASYRSVRLLYRLFAPLSPGEDPRYDHVLSASDELDSVVARLPPELQISAEMDPAPADTSAAAANDRVAVIRRLLGMTLAHRSYLVHRAYYIKSFRDRSYSPSHAACTQAATDIIMLAERGLPPVFYRLWNITSWLVVAGIVLALDLLQAADSKRPVHDAPSRRHTLRNVVHLLYHSDRTGIASRGAALITHLARAEGEILSGARTGVKFTRDDIVGLVQNSEKSDDQQQPQQHHLHHPQHAPHHHQHHQAHAHQSTLHQFGNPPHRWDSDLQTGGTGAYPQPQQPSHMYRTDGYMPSAQQPPAIASVPSQAGPLDGHHAMQAPFSGSGGINPMSHIFPPMGFPPASGSQSATMGDHLAWAPVGVEAGGAQGIEYQDGNILAFLDELFPQSG